MRNPDLKIVASDGANTPKLDVTTDETDKLNLHDRDYNPRLGLPILLGMNKLGKDIFGGLNTDRQINALHKRRAKNRVARKARRINRVRAR